MAIEDRLRDVRGWLRDMDADVRDSGGDRPTLSFRRGSALVHVAAFGGGDKPEMLRFSACVVRKARAGEKPELLAYLLRQNEDMVFCSFSVDGEGDVWLNTALLAQHLDRKAFLYAMSEMLAVADTADDRIVRRWGGERFVDV